MRQDDVRDPLVGDLAKVAQRGRSVLGGAGGVDGDHPIGGDHEGEVGEVVSLGDMHAGGEFTLSEKAAK